MFKLDLKKAEVALKAGRLDEAAGLLEGSNDGEHALGQKLKDKLVAELVKRGQQHLADDRLAAAAADARLAKKLGGHQVAVLALEQQLQSRERSVAQGIKDRSLQDAKTQMQSLIEAGANESGIRFFKSLSDAGQKDPSIIESLNQAVDVLVEGAWEDFDRGRLDRCDRTMQLIAGVHLITDGARQVELFGLLKKVQSALVAAGEARFRVAADELQKVKLIASKTTWIDGALAGLQKCIQGLSEFMTGPVGLLDSVALQVSLANPSRPKQNKRLDLTNLRRPVAPELSCGRSILQVDQVGSLLMLTGDHFSIGTTSTKVRPDVVLQTEGMRDAVYIRRSGEDYIAACNSPFVVNRKTLRERVLSDGDSIEIGKRGRLTFSKPVAASNTAVLKISGSKLVRRDVRWIVLVGDAVLFGNSNSHFRISGLENRVIVRPVAQALPESGLINTQRETEFLIHQKGDSDPQLLRSGEQVVLDECRFSLNATSIEPSSSIGHRSHS